MDDRATVGSGMLSRVALPERYELLHHIADGGMASVWCTRDRILHRNVAIKLLAERYAHDQTAVRRFEREARAAARVSGHRHVVTIYDVGTAGFGPGADVPDAGAGVPFIAMEHLDGGTVHDALTDGPVDPDLALRWLRETAAALDYAHERGVIHRDIKPNNLLLDRSRSVRVSDFGIARLVAEASITTVGEVLGTAAYLPPEQAIGGPATADGDRYSLAVVAYELLAGSRPFDGNRLASLVDSRGGFRPAPASSRNPSLPRAADAVLARGLARVPSRRWPTATEFVQRLAQAVGRAPAVAVPAPKWSYTHVRSRPSRPRLTTALAVIAAIAFLVGIAAGANAGGTRTPSPGAAARERAQRPADARRARAAGRAGQARRVSTAPAHPAPTPSTPASAPSQPLPGGPTGEPRLGHHRGRGSRFWHGIPPGHLRHHPDVGPPVDGGASPGGD